RAQDEPDNPIDQRERDQRAAGDGKKCADDPFPEIVETLQNRNVAQQAVLADDPASPSWEPHQRHPTTLLRPNQSVTPGPNRRAALTYKEILNGPPAVAWPGNIDTGQSEAGAIAARAKPYCSLSRAIRNSKTAQISSDE